MRYYVTESERQFLGVLIPTSVVLTVVTDSTPSLIVVIGKGIERRIVVAARGMVVAVTHLAWKRRVDCPSIPCLVVVKWEALLALSTMETLVRHTQILLTLVINRSTHHVSLCVVITLTDSRCIQ